MTDVATTHAEGCWAWGPKHYSCAVREIKALRAERKRAAAAQAELHGEARAGRLAEALEEIRSRSSMNLAMRSDTFDLTAKLGDIYQIADAALAKEDRND